MARPMFRRMTIQIMIVFGPLERKKKTTINTKITSLKNMHHFQTEELCRQAIHCNKAKPRPWNPTAMYRYYRSVPLYTWPNKKEQTRWSSTG